jgi:DNA-binding CsgD family transcriptional regulator
MVSRPAGSYTRGMNKPLGTSAVIAHEAIHRLSLSGLAPLEFLRQVATRVRSVVRYDAGAWLTMDPATLLQTGAFIQGLGDSPGDVHLRYADNEHLAPDFTKLTDVARLPRPVVTLGDATDGDLSRSIRHRTIHADLGVAHEVRAAFRDGESTWGAFCACRNEGQPDFSDAEKDFIAGIGQHVGHGLRLGLMLEAATRAEGRDTPGVIVLGADGSTESITPEAEEWLAQIPRDRGASFELPTVIHIELAPLIIELYELSPRERQVTELLLRGLPIEEIAASLWISRHTVRDYTKAIFAKLGVGSRPELTAKLFHDHYLPTMDYAS